MRKRTITLLLALGLLLTTPALAVQDGAFSRIRTYDGQFSDLTAGSVFYDNVSALYEYGLSVGQPDGTFGLTDSLTVGQAVIFAGRIRSLYQTGDPETGPDAYGGDGDDLTARRYLRYLQAEGVLDHALDDVLTQTATRAQMAHVLANVLPESALPPVHDSLVTQAYAGRKAITDVTEYTPYYQDILDLYRKGISIGSDAAGSFLPDAPITRGAAAAMLTRIVDPALRVTPQWDLTEEHSAQGAALSDLVDPGRYIAAPATRAEMDESIRYMLATDSHQLTLNYPGISVVQARKVMQEAISVLKSYCEQGYNSVTCRFSTTGSISLDFSALELTAEQTQAYRTAAMEDAVAVHDQLWADGTLTDSMTDAEKARVYYTWICENCVYDYDAADTSLSHLPYNLFENGTAVCDGYTGAYNMLLKLEGIDCYGLSNTGHIWTVANLDGTEVHIDTTWGDSNPAAIDYSYFAMTPAESWQAHPW